MVTSVLVRDSVDSLIVRSIEKENKHCFFMKSLKKNGQSNPVNATLNEIVQLTEA